MFRTNLGVMRGLEYEHEVEYTVDGARVHTFRMGGEADFKANLVNMTKAGDVIDERGRIRLKLTAGPHVIGAAFIARSEALNPTRLQPFIRSSTDTRDTSGHPHFDTLHRHRSVQCDRVRRHAEPPRGSSSLPSRRRARARKIACARQIIARLARLAYRGDATDVDLQRLFALLRSRAVQSQAARSRPAFRRRCSACWRARSSASTSNRIRPACAPGDGLSHQRSRARLAPVVLPLEQHPRHAAARPGGAEQAAHAGGARAAGPAHAGRSEGRAR